MEDTTQYPKTIGSDWDHELGFIQCTQPGVRTNVVKVPAWDFRTLVISRPHWRLPNGAWSGGGPFLTYRTSEYIKDSADWSEKKYGYKYAYRVGAPLHKLSFVTVPSSAPSYETKFHDLQPHYATGRARTLPGRPVGNIGQFVIEARQVPAIPFQGILKKVGKLYYSRMPFHLIPSYLYFELKQFLRSYQPRHFRPRPKVLGQLGGEYLNVRFGWEPLLRDLRLMYHLQRDVDKALAKLLKENNQGIHRRITLENDTSVTTAQDTSNYAFAFLGCPLPSTIVGKTRRETKRVLKVKRWYSARYHYFISEANIASWAWTAKAKLALLGALPTPETIWEVLPWSWLIDWFTNVGDFMTNISYTPAENLYSDYAFVMEHVREEVETVVTTTFGDSNTQARTYKGLDGKRFVRTSVRETKSRAGGNYLFGLGITGGVATSYQLGILAALGASKSML